MLQTSLQQCKAKQSKAEAKYKDNARAIHGKYLKQNE
jgi:hypothetical protein